MTLEKSELETREQAILNDGGRFGWKLAKRGRLRSSRKCRLIGHRFSFEMPAMLTTPRREHRIKMAAIGCVTCCGDAPFTPPPPSISFFSPSYRLCFPLGWDDLWLVALRSVSSVCFVNWVPYRVGVEFWFDGFGQGSMGSIEWGGVWTPLFQIHTMNPSQNSFWTHFSFLSIFSFGLKMLVQQFSPLQNFSGGAFFFKRRLGFMLI